MPRRFCNGCVANTLAALALAMYASASLLGYGLHSIGACEHEAPGPHLATCHGHQCESSHSCHDRHAPSCEHPPRLATAHDACLICSYLAQAQTNVVPRVTIDGLEPLAEAAEQGVSLIMATCATSHFARGPPAA